MSLNLCRYCCRGYVVIAAWIETNLSLLLHYQPDVFRPVQWRRPRPALQSAAGPFLSGKGKKTMNVIITAETKTDIQDQISKALSELTHLFPLLPNGPARSVFCRCANDIGSALARLESCQADDLPSPN
jgi:hypothetical protein